jgi:hypothetical protein
LRISHTLAVPLLAASLLASCGNDKTARRPDPPTKPAAPAAQDAAAPTALTLTGPAAFQGPAPVQCVLSDQSGVQINFRTGDAETPAVALRIDDYRGAGPYAAQVFVTGRSTAGGLVTSTGEAHVDMRQDIPQTGGPVVLLSGTLDGTYQGEAGKGTVEGRFSACGYSRDRGALAQAANATLTPSHVGSEGNSPTDATEPPNHESTAPTRLVETSPARPRHPRQATGTARRLRRSTRHAAHRRRR